MVAVSIELNENIRSLSAFVVNKQSAIVLPFFFTILVRDLALVHCNCVWYLKIESKIVTIPCCNEAAAMPNVKKIYTHSCVPNYDHVSNRVTD